MSVFYVDLVLAAWLVVSVFTLGHSRLSAVLVALGAVAIAALARLATVREVLRFAAGAVALVLAVLALVLPGLAAAARINTAVVGLVILALSAVPPAHAHGRPQPVSGPPGERLPPD